MTASGSLKMVRPGHHRQVNRETCDDMVLFHSFLEDLRPHNSFPNQAEQGEYIGEILHGCSRHQRFGHGVFVQEPLGTRPVVTAGTSGHHHGF